MPDTVGNSDDAKAKACYLGTFVEALVEEGLTAMKIPGGTCVA